jgi:hypothetical protein
MTTTPVVAGGDASAFVAGIQTAERTAARIQIAARFMGDLLWDAMGSARVGQPANPGFPQRDSKTMPLLYFYKK